MGDIIDMTKPVTMNTGVKIGGGMGPVTGSLTFGTQELRKNYGITVTVHLIKLICFLWTSLRGWIGRSRPPMEGVEIQSKEFAGWFLTFIPISATCLAVASHSGSGS